MNRPMLVLAMEELREVFLIWLLSPGSIHPSRRIPADSVDPLRDEDLSRTPMPPRLVEALLVLAAASFSLAPTSDSFAL